jgi:hypothetical protein
MIDQVIDAFPSGPFPVPVLLLDLPGAAPGPKPVFQIVKLVQQFPHILSLLRGLSSGTGHIEEYSNSC